MRHADIKTTMNTYGSAFEKTKRRANSRVADLVLPPAIKRQLRAGLRNALHKGKILGRPRVIVDAAKIATLRASGASWRAISKQLGVGIGTVYNAARQRSENVSPTAPASG
jgi:hypothetical protein